MKKQIGNILWLMPLYICGGLAGASIMSLLEIWDKSLLDYFFYIGITIITFIISLWWIKGLFK
jgi:hypothetical protein